MKKSDRSSRQKADSNLQGREKTVFRSGNLTEQCVKSYYTSPEACVLMLNAARHSAVGIFDKDK